MREFNCPRPPLGIAAGGGRCLGYVYAGSLVKATGVFVPAGEWPHHISRLSKSTELAFFNWEPPRLFTLDCSDEYGISVTAWPPEGQSQKGGAKSAAFRSDCEQEKASHPMHRVTPYSAWYADMCPFGRDVDPYLRPAVNRT